jgi:hypothetical protein
MLREKCGYFQLTGRSRSWNEFWFIQQLEMTDEHWTMDHSKDLRWEILLVPITNTSTVYKVPVSKRDPHHQNSPLSTRLPSPERRIVTWFGIPLVRLCSNESVWYPRVTMVAANNDILLVDCSHVRFELPRVALLLYTHWEFCNTHNFFV